MSTKSSLYCDQSDEKWGLRIHVYHEMHDELFYVELNCATSYSGVKFVLPEHLARKLVDRLNRKLPE